MFNSNFYPTPKEVIEKMLLGADVYNKVILEPSAGKGDIVDFLQENGAKEVIACEANHDLAKVVSSKCNLLKEDFLEVQSDEVSHLDMIIMNPPFSDDCKHILHAFEVAPGGCEIIALCNYETVRNAYSESRRLLSEIIEFNGRYEDFGNCFGSAERNTDVRVACVYLFKPKTGEDEFADFFDMEEELGPDKEGVVRYDYVQDIVSRYVGAVKLFDDVMKASERINALTAPINRHGIKFGAYKHGENYGNENITRDYFAKDLQKRAWRKLFDDMNMDKYLTKGVRETINSFVEKQENVPFKVSNIYRMVEMIVGTHGSRMGQVLIEAFDMICSFSAENSTAGEKWKTNSDYMINKKFIVPGVCEYDARYPSGSVKIRYSSNRDKVDDLNRAMCILTGTRYEDIQNLYSFVGNITGAKDTYENRQMGLVLPMRWGEWYEWGFFKIRGYKKGTMHFQFLDDSVWERFNIEVAKAKGWQLPKGRKRKKGEVVVI